MRMAQAAAMAISVNLSTPLRAWITDNLERATPPAAMIEALITHNMAPDVARGVVDVFVRAHADGRPLPGHSVRLEQPCRRTRRSPAIAPGHVIRAGDCEIPVLHRMHSPIAVMLEQVLERI